jgi:hypothetical protein
MSLTARLNFLTRPVFLKMCQTGVLAGLSKIALSSWA